jgi:ABC-type sugar transport system substrate-binding protein
MLRIIKAVTVAVLGALVVAGIATATVKKSAASSKGPFTICAVQNNADHPSITAIVKGFKDEGPHYGAKVTSLDPAGDPQKQASMIQDCIARKPSVIAVNAVDPVAVIPSLKKAHDAHIPVLMFNADTTDAGHAYTQVFVGSQSFDQGFAVGQMIAKQLNNKGTVVVIEGNPGQTDTVNRLSGMKAGFAASHAQIKVLAAQTANWSQDKAVTVMTALLTRYPKIDAVFGEDDNMALGALQAIQARGRAGKVKVFGVNGQKAACDAIKNGAMAGTALQLSYMVGVYSIRAAYDLHMGRLVPKQLLAPTAPVTKANVAQWQSQCF